ncbi:Hypothetical Protein FCC1311_043812 [Hondaea fermentalgiana]|uniref:Uncharacterized protein n=1 Tax=Hondaea fermentalgiana TaxID=2315210 RepID=A0A2R5GEI8_9STRA|nr:Hypothetical Protein FCC1311_043812 [Hondaea fermentalgiana]|eukprot:GBG28158.1 Hypothetical Protein FCC1311_043812 [Hondaea fermentalgiana]
MTTTTADPDCNDDRQEDVPVSSSEANGQGTESRAESSVTPDQLGASHGPVEHLQGAELEHLQKKHVEACAALEKALGRLNADEDEVSTLRQQLDLMREQISTDIESAASIIRQQQRASRVRTPPQPSVSNIVNAFDHIEISIANRAES